MHDQIHCFWLVAVLGVFGSTSLLAEPAQPLAFQENFQKLTPDTWPSELMKVDGEFRIAAEGEEKFLEMLAEPVIDGAVLIGPSISGPAQIRAKLQGAGGRRSSPQIGVGLHGTSGAKVKISSSQSSIEIFQGEDSVAKTEWKGRTDVEQWVELTITPQGSQWLAEARVWPAGNERPAAATFSAPLPKASGQGRAVLYGAPFANKPIRFDDVEISSLVPTATK